jgi:SNW domain-containing protein 1
MFDQRLFNQTSGLDTGFGDEDDYNLYDKPLFTDRTAASIYKGVKEVPVNDDEGEQGGEVKRVLNQPSRGFEGTDYTKGARNKPVEFEKRKLEQADDNFGEGGLRERADPNKRRRVD